MEKKLPTDCILLAAGESKRMGNKWKMMLDFEDSTIIDCSIKNAMAACSNVIVVVGHRGDELKNYLKNKYSIKIVYNENYKQGMLTSLKEGIKHVTTKYFFIALADMPKISPNLYKTLYSCAKNDIVFPAFKGNKGHPVLISKKISKHIINEKDNAKKTKDILMQFPIKQVSVDSEFVLYDIDRQADFNKRQDGKYRKL